MPCIAAIAAPSAAAGERVDAMPKAPGQLRRARRGGCHCQGGCCCCCCWPGAAHRSTGEGGRAPALLLSGCCCSAAGLLPQVLGVLGGCSADLPVGLSSASGLGQKRSSTLGHLKQQSTSLNMPSMVKSDTREELLLCR